MGKRRQMVLQYIQRLLRLCASKATKNTNTANMHRQWKLTVRTVAQPWQHTQTSYMLTVCRHVVSPGSSVCNFNCSTDKTRMVDSNVTATVQTSHDNTQKNQAYSTHSRWRTQRRTHRNVFNSMTSITFFNHSAAGCFFK